MERNKIFIEQEHTTGDFLMRMPAEALPAFYEMLLTMPLIPRRWFYQVIKHLEKNYSEQIKRSDDSTVIQ